MTAHMSRRRFLQISALSAGAIATPLTINALGSASSDTTQRRPLGAPGKEPRGPRRNGSNLLVIIEMAGGHDGFSTIVPYADRRYQSLRSVTRVEQPITMSDGHGWHPALAHLARRGAAGVLGVGVADPNLSHFEMSQRWWSATPGGATPASFGFLGRLCDEVGSADAPAVGVSIGGQVTPALLSNVASTLAVGYDDLGAVPAPPESDVARQVWLQTLEQFGRAADRDSPLAAAQTGIARANRFGADVANLTAGEVEYPGGALAQQLKLTARLASANLGIRIIHIPWGSFDTHTGHNESHANQLTEFDAAVEVFRSDIARRGVDHRVVVATTSEFGRRASDNASNGLDHGTANNMIIFGTPVNTGLYGTPVDFARLDEDGNAKATTSMTDYYATLANWLGVDAARVLPKGSTPIEGLVNDLGRSRINA